MALLAVNDLHISYGGIGAVRRLSLTVGEGEVVGVLGPNGAGKSSTLAAIAGGVTPQRGKITYAGRDITGGRAEEIARSGISLVPEGRHVFATLTVEENLAIGTYMHKEKADVAGVLERFPRLKERRDFPAGRLSGGEQQMLVIARAMLAKPRLMLVDEPSLGLAPIVIDQVYEILRELRAQGMSLLVVEQSTSRILKHADRIYVLRGGAVQLEDAAANLQGGEAIKRAYFGFEEGAA